MFTLENGQKQETVERDMDMAHLRKSTCNSMHLGVIGFTETKPPEKRESRRFPQQQLTLKHYSTIEGPIKRFSLNHNNQRQLLATIMMKKIELTCFSSFWVNFLQVM